MLGPNGPAPQHFSAVDGKIVEIAPGVLVCEARMRPGYATCRENYLLLQGSLSGMSRTLGYGPANVDLELRDDGARFVIRVPVRGGVLAWLRRGVGWLVAARWAGRELREAHDALHRKYVELQHEIAAREEAERERAAAHHRLEGILDALPTGCLVHNPSGRVTWWNSAAERLFGPRVRGAAIGGLAPDADPLMEPGPIRRDGTDAGGRPVRIEWSHTPLRAEGGLVGWVSTCTD